MLLENIINVKVSNRTKKYFIDKGYVEKNEFFHVLPEDMNDTNRTIVKCKCLYCEVVNDVTWSNYIIQISKTDEKIYCCHKCHFNKTKIKYMMNHGVDNIQILESVKNKIKRTNLERYGVEYSINSDEIKNKIKETNLKKYSVEYSISSKFVRNKIIVSFIEKYGVKNPFQSNSKFRDSINEKLKVSLNKNDVKEKRKETNLKKYGFSNPMQLNLNKEKSKNKSGQQPLSVINLARKTRVKFLLFIYCKFLNKRGCIKSLKSK